MHVAEVKAGEGVAIARGGDAVAGDQHNYNFFMADAAAAAELHERLATAKRAEPAALPAGVPPRPFGFVERTALAKRLDEALRKGSAALVGVAGEGGVGKTTLAAEYARGFEGAVVWVDVRTARGSTAAVAQELLGKLGAGTGPVASAEAGLAALLPVLEARARDGRTLLVLDNADHPDADLGGFLDKLAYAPGTAVVVTTRDPAFAERLDAVGVDVGALDPDEGVALLRAWLGEDPRASDAAGLRKVAEHERCVALWVGLGGSILKRHAKLSPAEYVRGPGAFDRIWKELPAEAQGLFVAGGACAPTGFGLGAVMAAAWVTKGTAKEGLQQLLAKAMVTALPDGRWMLHPLLRERARAQAGFAKAAERHGEWVLEVVGTAPREIDRVEAVKDEVAAAVENAMVTRSGKRLVRLCSRAEYYWRQRGPWAFADRALEQAVDVARKAGNDGDISSLLLGRASILRAAGNWDGALALYDERERLDRGRGAMLDLATTLSGAAYPLTLRGDLANARVKLEEALRLQEQHGSSMRELGITLHELGGLESKAREYEAALAYYRRALDIQDDEAEKTITLHSMGVVHAARNQHREALALFDEALAIYRRLCRPAKVAAALIAKANARAALGEDAAAEACYAESLALCKDMGDVHWTAENQVRLAMLRLRQGRPAEARALVESALPVYERLGERDRIDACRDLLATLPPA